MSKHNYKSNENNQNNRRQKGCSTERKLRGRRPQSFSEPTYILTKIGAVKNVGYDSS